LGENTRRIVQLKQRPYTRQKKTIRFSIIPPEWNKQFSVPPWKQLWKAAAKAIRSNKTLVVIGYSFPPSDLHTTSLFRLNVSTGLRNLVIVNPDKRARQRTRDVLQAGLTIETRVLVFDSLREFHSVDRKLWDHKPIKKKANTAKAVDAKDS
jgi:hypothetical protein